MTYSPGQRITAADFNTFRDQVVQTYGVGNSRRGYGQTQGMFGAVAPGQRVENESWLALRDMIYRCAYHQGTTSSLPGTTYMEDGDVILAHTSAANPGDLATMANLMTDEVTYTNYNIALHSTTHALRISRTGPWSGSLSCQFQVAFGNGDQARYFFNTGGIIKITPRRTGGSATPQNSSWSQLLQSVENELTVDKEKYGLTYPGSLILWDMGGAYYNFSAFGTNWTPQGSAGGPMVGSGVYAANEFRCYIRRNAVNVSGNGDGGNILTARLDFIDGHTNEWFDEVDGTLYVDVHVRKSNYFNVPGPSVTTVQNL